jgi:GNAT superfamily N-acetyltransferase
MHFKDTAPGFHARPASPGELSMAFAMLPHVSGKGVPPESVFVAKVPGVEGIVGAGAFSVLPVNAEKPGVRGDIFVLPSFRGKGIGRTVLARMKDSAHDWDIAYLHTWNSVELAASSGFLAQAGFEILKKTFRFEVDTEKACSVLNNWLTRRQFEKRIPSGAEVLPLDSIDRTEAVKLYSAYFGCLEQQAREYLALTLSRELVAKLSFGLLLNGKLIGFILWKRDLDGVPAVELWITDRSFHTGWPAIALLGASINCGARLGYTKGRFEYDEGARASMHMARLMNARLINTVVGCAIEV